MTAFTIPEYGELRCGGGEGEAGAAQIEALLAAGAAASLGLAESARRSGLPPRDEDDERKPSEDRVVRPSRNGLRAAGIVGVLTAGDVTLEILPKIDDALETNAKDDAKPREQLIHMLADALDLPLDMRPDARLGTQDQTLLDVVIISFVSRLEAAVRRGLARRYVAVNDDLPVLRGRLDVRRQYTALLAMPWKVACGFDELSVDTPLNRCLKATLVLLHVHARAEPVRRAIVALLPAFDGVRDRSVEFGAARRQLDRTDRAFHELLDLAELLTRSQYQTSSSGRDAGLALLFDMPTLFERAVATALRRVAGPEERVSTQDTSESLMARSKAFTLKPDIVVRRGDETVILDTKWKRPDGNPSSGDAYQMLAYAHAYGARDCILVYPSAKTLSASEDKSRPRRTAVTGRPLVRPSSRDQDGRVSSFEWRLHQADLSLADYTTVDAQLRAMLNPFPPA